MTCSSLRCSGMAHVIQGPHRFTCHRRVYPQVEWNHPAFIPQPQSITALWLVLISCFAERRRLSWHLFVSKQSIGYFRTLHPFFVVCLLWTHARLNWIILLRRRCWFVRVFAGDHCCSSVARLSSHTRRRRRLPQKVGQISPSSYNVNSFYISTVFRYFLWPPALRSRCGHYIFIMWLLPSFFLSSSFFPRLISAVGDWMSTILSHMVWPWCKFRMQVWNVLRAARWKYRTQKIAN